MRNHSTLKKKRRKRNNDSCDELWMKLFLFRYSTSATMAGRYRSSVPTVPSFSNRSWFAIGGSRWTVANPPSCTSKAASSYSRRKEDEPRRAERNRNSTINNRSSSKIAANKTITTTFKILVTTGNRMEGSNLTRSLPKITSCNRTERGSNPPVILTPAIISAGNRTRKEITINCSVLMGFNHRINRPTWSNNSINLQGIPRKGT